MKINIEPENDGGLVGRWFSLKPGVYSLSAFSRSSSRVYHLSNQNPMLLWGDFTLL